MSLVIFIGISYCNLLKISFDTNSLNFFMLLDVYFQRPKIVFACFLLFEIKVTVAPLAGAPFLLNGLILSLIFNEKLLDCIKFMKIENQNNALSLLMILIILLKILKLLNMILNATSQNQKNSQPLYSSL